MQWRHPLSLSIAQNMVASSQSNASATDLQQQQQVAEQMLKSNMPPTALLTPSPPIISSHSPHLPPQINYKNLISLREMMLQQHQQQIIQQPSNDCPNDTTLSNMKRSLIEQSLPAFAQSLVAPTKNINNLLANLSSPSPPPLPTTLSSTMRQSPSPKCTSLIHTTSSTGAGNVMKNNFMLSEISRKYENKLIDDPNEDDISRSSDAEKRKMLYQQEMQLKIQQQHLQQQQEELNRQQEEMNKQRAEMMNNNDREMCDIKKEPDVMGGTYAYGSDELIPKKRRKLSIGKLKIKLYM
jgi:hypothetical protein